MFSILPFYAVAVIGFCILLIVNVKKSEEIDGFDRKSIWIIIALLIGWTIILTIMGYRNLHVKLMESIPLLWQAFVPVTIWMTVLAVSPKARKSMHKIAMSTPDRWLVWIQALRLGAIGGVVKGVTGSIESSYVLWVGIPDVLFGLSALVLGWLLRSRSVPRKILLTWNLVGFSIIFFPTFAVMNHWMNEPGFTFIFEFPMILAPGNVVSMLISMNLMHAWAALYSDRRRAQSSMIEA